MELSAENQIMRAHSKSKKMQIMQRLIIHIRDPRFNIIFKIWCGICELPEPRYGEESIKRQRNAWRNLQQRLGRNVVVVGMKEKEILGASSLSLSLSTWERRERREREEEHECLPLHSSKPGISLLLMFARKLRDLRLAPCFGR